MVIEVNQRISLRPPRQEYANDLYRILRDQRPYLQYWMPWAGQVQSVSDLQRFLWETARYNQGGQRFLTFIFYNSELAGSIGLTRINRRNRSGELGYWLSREYQGRGIIHKSCRQLMAFAFHKLNLNRIEIRILKNNEKSLTLAKKLGFVYEGTLRESLCFKDSYLDLELFSFLKKDFK